MLFHQLGDRGVDEHQLPDDVGDVELARRLAAGLLEPLHFRPVGFEFEEVEEPLDVDQEEVDDVEDWEGISSPSLPSIVFLARLIS